jgi:hypothetical protein
MSAAVVVPTAPQIWKLLRNARARNQQEGVTGVLLYDDGSFFQYIEGPFDAVMRVQEAILRDPLHHLIFELLSEPIEKREFPHWTLGYRGTESVEDITRDSSLNMLLSDGSKKLPPGRLLLNAFWSNGLAARYAGAGPR